MKHFYLYLFCLALSFTCFAQERKFAYTISTDESSVPAYTLPDPLVLSNGNQVKTIRCWEKRRRPEILELFTKEMFGTAPSSPKNLKFELVSIDSSAFDGLAVRKTVRICLNETTSFHILVHVPTSLSAPAPVFVGLNFNGNDQTLEGKTAYRWPYKTILKSGYAVATAWRDEIDEDKWDKSGRGIRDAYSDKYTWGSIAAWSWAISRILDYLETDPAIDAGKSIVIGHSRLGKAALWAGACDRRFAMVISNNSGCGGAALSKRVFGENLDAIQEKFPHWFCKDFQKYRKNEAALPFDQHELLALIAPRPLYVASSTEDLWADPKGEWLSAVYASPVYELYGLKGVNAALEAMPAPDCPIQDGNIAYHIKTGRHSIRPYDWEQYLKFADKYFKTSCAEKYKNPLVPIEERVEDLLSRMTFEEKVWQISQGFIGKNDNPNNVLNTFVNVPPTVGSLIYYGLTAELGNILQKVAVDSTRLGIPILYGYDAIHGFHTEFPIPLAQAASFNPDLAGQANRITAQECYNAGVHWNFSPMTDISRDPRWGRIMEGYGEDPYLSSVFTAATVKAYQGDDPSKPGNIAACLKHYVGYGASEAGRDYTATDISRQLLWDTYLQPFQAGVEAGALTLMSSFNTLSGVPASGNHYTLTEVLKEKWGHDGFVVSDWGAVKQLVLQGMAVDKKDAAAIALNAGVEMDMCDFTYSTLLEELVKEGRVSIATIDEAVRRVLRVKFRLGLFENPYRKVVEPKDEFSEEKFNIVEQLAQESMVLLKNDGVLPLGKEIKSIALTGPLADDKDIILGGWRSHSSPSQSISVLEAMQNEFPGKINYTQGCSVAGSGQNDLNPFGAIAQSGSTKGMKDAVKLAEKSDVVVLCLGEGKYWTGENKTRASICLPDDQIQLFDELCKTGKKVVVVIESGRPLDLRHIEEKAAAILFEWCPGHRGGPAVAGLLSGKYNPSGKLPVTFPAGIGQVPIYYNHRDRARRGTWGEYIDGTPLSPLYDFGYGLSYSKFEYGDITIDGLTAKVKVTNNSQRDGKETVLWFVTDPACHIARPVKELKHFEKRLIKAGQTEEFVFQIDKLKDLGFVDDNGNRFFEGGKFIITVGGKTLSINID